MTKNVLKTTSCLVALLCLCGGLIAQETGDFSGQDPLPSAARVQQLTREWVGVEKTISEEEAQWEEDQHHMRDLLNVWGTEIKQLEEIIAAAGSRLEDAEEKKASLLAEEQELRQQRALLLESVGELEESLRPLLSAFPPPLQKIVADAGDRLKNPEGSRPLQERFRDVLAILNEAISFDRAISVKSEMREKEGQEVEVRVLYLGLGQAYYADRTGRTAGWGNPTAEGWVWTEEPALGPEVLKAISIHQNESTPEIIRLPVEVK